MRTSNRIALLSVIASGVASLSASFGCASNSLLPESDQLAVESELQSHARFLKVAMRVAPLFQDDGKWLIADRGLDEIDLIDDTAGKPVAPGAAVGILLPGTRLRIDRVEFPTALVIAGRPIYSPRYAPWVYLVPADPSSPEVALAHGKPFILVLPPRLRSREEVLAELDRYLATDASTIAFQSLPPQVQEAIAQKTVLPGMTSTQIEMAWGYPERIHIDEAQKLEVWTWPFGLQTAALKAGMLASWVDHGTAGGAK